ncbi:MAG: hypothetical protein ACKE8R_02490 [Methylophagaceae bacterium]
MKRILLVTAFALMNFISLCSISYAEALSEIPLFVSHYFENQQLTIGNKYYTGFETREEFSQFYIVPQNHKNSTTHDLTFENKVSGNKSHKAWIYDRNEVVKGINTNHRGYPTFQFEKTSLGIVKNAVLIDFWVFVDMPLKNKKGESWVSLATLVSYSDINWPRTYQINIDSQAKLHLMHIPNQTQNVSDIYEAKNLIFPEKRWVRVTAYIDYTDDNQFDGPFIAIWQDGVLAAAAHFNDRINPQAAPAEIWPKCLDSWSQKSIEEAEALCELVYEGGLAQAHFGMYAPPGLSTGVIYNDELTIVEVIKEAVVDN